MEAHALIGESSDVCEVEATGCLWTHFPSRAEPLWKWQSRKRWPNYTTGMHFHRIIRQQYAISFNQTRRARQSSSTNYPPPLTQKICHLDARWTPLDIYAFLNFS